MLFGTVNWLLPAELAENVKHVQIDKTYFTVKSWVPLVLETRAKLRSFHVNEVKNIISPSLFPLTILLFLIGKAIFLKIINKRRLQNM